MIDISTYLDKDTITWPGDQAFCSNQTLQINGGDSVNLCSIHTSTHNGTHADAPWHYDDTSPRIDEVALGPYMGPCVVVDALGISTVRPSVMEGADVRRGDRVLFRTRSGPASTAWEGNNPHLAVNTVIALRHYNCPLVGIDSPSVDPSTSTSLLAHHALGDSNIMILENLELANAVPGRYILVAFPLKLRGLDASPVRAVLLTPHEARGVLAV